MKNKEFEPEVTQVEETTESAAPGAIDVSEAKQSNLVKLEETVKLLPVIPETLNIKGVELNIEVLTNSIKEVKEMKIDGLGDKEGYDAAAAKLKEISKLRTSSETWRKEVMKPVLLFGKTLKTKIDKAGELCLDGEEHLKAIMKPIDDAVEIARQEAEAAKDKLATERAALLVAMGGVFDGNGTYNFEYDGGLFVLSDDLRKLDEAKWTIIHDEIKTSWDLEQKRLQDIEDAKNAETNLLKSQVEDLNKERTAFRIKELVKLEGFTPSEDGESYTRGELVISRDQVLSVSMEDWDALINPPEWTEEYTGPQGDDVSDMNETLAQDQEQNDGVPKGTYSFKGIANDFPETTEVEEGIADVEFEVAEVPGKAFSRSLFFSEAKPSVEFAIGDKFKMKIYPIEFEDLANDGVAPASVAVAGIVNDQLNFLLLKK